MLSATNVAAQTAPDWFVHVGPARIALTDDARLKLAGAPVDNAGVREDARYTPAVEIGRFVVPTVALSLTVGLPVRQQVYGTGTIAPFGKLGSLRYGPAAAMVQWHPLRSAAVRPYVGGGVAYLHVFDTDDGALRGLHVDDGVGPVVQVGADVPIARTFALFADAKKAFLRTDATGSLGPAPVTARLRMDPLVLHAGVALRF